MQTLLGPIVTADEVCVAVEATLRAWLPAMLTAMGVADDLEAPKGYRQTPTVEALQKAEDQLPAIGISSPGLADEPIRDEDGNLRLVWRVFVVAYVRGEDYEQTQRNTRNYAAAIATILLQQSTLFDFASDTMLVSEGYEPIDIGARTLGGAIVEVNVAVDEARNDLGAPIGAPPDPLPATVAVAEVDIDVEELP